MPQPTVGDVHINVPLSQFTLLARQDDDEFVADRVFQTIPVTQRSDVYYTYNSGDFTRNQMKLRAPGAESAGAGYRIDGTPTFQCDVWSLHKDIPDQVRANADSMLAPDMEATLFLSDQARLNRELLFATTYFAASVWGTEWSGTASAPVAGTSLLYWSDPASDPIADVRALKQAIQLKCLKRPNVMTLSRPVFDILCDHPTLIDRLKFGQTAPRPAQVLKQVLAILFEVDEVLVMDAIQNTGVEDPAATFAVPGADSTFAFVGSKNVLLSYRPPVPGLMTAAAGYNFAWSGYLGATAMGTRIKTFYMPWLASTRVEIDNAFVQKVVGKNFAGFLNGIIA